MSFWQQFWRHFAPFGNTRAVSAETAFVPLLAVGLGIWINPLDPLWIDGDFPWAWLAPLLLSLRYGPLPGILGAGMLFAAWLALNAAGMQTGEFPRLYFLGGLIMVMLSGEFSSLWVARARRAEGVQVYLDQRLEFLTRQHYLLRLSHDRLEQDLLSRPMALRDALAAVRDREELTTTAHAAGECTSPVHNAQTLLPGADALLKLLAQLCQLEGAAVFAARDGDLLEQPAATLGEMSPLEREDPLVQRALEDGQAWHLQLALGEDAQDSHYLIVVPLRAQGETLGLLVVERIPFFALQEETLQMLNLVVGYFSDGLMLDRLAVPVLAAYPECPPEFAGELNRLTRVRRETALASTLTALEFRNHATGMDLAQQLQRQKRGLDLNWIIDTPERLVLVTLMPLAGIAAAEGYFLRVEQWVRMQLGQSLDEAGVFCHQSSVLDINPLSPLDAVLAASHVDAALASGGGTPHVVG